MLPQAEFLTHQVVKEHILRYYSFSTCLVVPLMIERWVRIGRCDRFSAPDFPKTGRLRLPTPNNAKVCSEMSDRERAFRKTECSTFVSTLTVAERKRESADKRSHRSLCAFSTLFRYIHTTLKYKDCFDIILMYKRFSYLRTEWQISHVWTGPPPFSRSW